MARRKGNKGKRLVWLVFCCTLGFAAILSVFILGHYRFNFTDSMPPGLYQIKPELSYHKGESVMVCLPDKIAQEGKARHYLGFGVSCKDWIEPVLKEIIATPGDTVTLTENSIEVNGQSVAAPLFKIDRQGRPTHPIIRGSYPNTQLYWLYGANDPTYSWDSRYYGGVAKENILGVARPVFIIGHS